MAVDDWFFEWLKAHLIRFPGQGLPELGAAGCDVYYGGWRKNFIRRGIHDIDIATEASEQLQCETLPHSSQHFPRLVEIAVSLYKARNTALGSSRDAHSFEAARLDAKDCPHCAGQGWATAYHPTPDAARRIPASVAAHCVCSAGRWIRRQCGQKDPVLYRRVLDFGEVLEGRTVWLSQPPHMPISEDDGDSGSARSQLEVLKQLLAADLTAKRTEPLPRARPRSWIDKPPVANDPILDRDPSWRSRDTDTENPIP